MRMEVENRALYPVLNKEEPNKDAQNTPILTKAPVT